MLRVRVAAVSVVLLLLGGCAARQAGPAEQAASAVPGGDIVIGAVLPLSGDQRAFGLSAGEGLRLAVEEQNRQGGIRGRRLSLRLLDSQGQPEVAASAFREIVQRERPVVVVGDVASSRTLAMAPLADSLQVPLITPTATNPRITLVGGRVRPYVFRACVVDPYQGAVMARFARDELRLKRVAVLEDVSNDYSTSLAAKFREAWTAHGEPLAARQTYRSDDRDFDRQLRAIQASGAEAIYLPGYYRDVATIAKQARAMGMPQVFLGGDGWDSMKLLEQARGALDGSFFTNHHDVGDPAPLVAPFYGQYLAAYGREPDVIGVLSYDTARIALAALERAADTTGPAVREALEQTRDFPAVSGPTTVGPTHDATKPLVIMRVQSDRFRYHGRIEPIPQ